MNAAHITPENLQDGSWLDKFHAMISQPLKSKPRIDGADKAAAIFTDMVS